MGIAQFLDNEFGVTMRVLRDGYYNGAYPRTGDVIVVDAKHVDALEESKFAVREMQVEPSTTTPMKLLKKMGGTHGR